MKSILLNFALLCLPFFSFGQIERKEGESWGEYSDRAAQKFDRLEPADSYFDYAPYRIEYHNKLHTFLLDSLNKRSMVRLLVLPSFSNEYVINLEKLGGLYFLTKVTVNKSIWYAESPDEIKVTLKDYDITKSLAEAMDQLYQTALLQTRFKNTGMMGVDGTTYHFTSSGIAGWRTAQKWSPRKGTKIHELIRLTEALVSNNVNELQLLIEIQKLQERFDKVNISDP